MDVTTLMVKDTSEAFAGCARVGTRVMDAVVAREDFVMLITEQYSLIKKLCPMIRLRLGSQAMAFQIAPLRSALPALELIIESFSLACTRTK